MSKYDEQHYYIACGEEHKMHTLRVVYWDRRWYGRVAEMEQFDVHVRNLAVDRDRAVAKADELGYGKLTVAEWVPEQLTELRARRTPEQIEAEKAARREEWLARLREDRERMGLGKYRDRSALEVFAEDPDYIAWFCLNLTDEDSARFTIEFLMEHDAVNDYVGEVSAALDEEQRKQDERDRIDAASEHVGEVGEKFTAQVTLEFRTAVEGHYGWSNLIKFRTADGDVLTTFTTAKWAEETVDSEWPGTGDYIADEGVTGTLTGTVKAHDTYKGTKQTMLTRTKFQIDH